MNRRRGPAWLAFVVVAVIATVGQNAFAQSYTWVTKAPMPTPRFYTSGGVIDGKLYVAGGYNFVQGYLATLEVYDPITDSWSAKSPLPSPRVSAAAAVINDKLYVAGGNDNNNNRVNTLFVYDPVADTWTTKAPKPTSGPGARAVAINGLLYVVGGCFGWCAPTANVLEVYNPATDTWTVKAPMPTSRREMDVAAVDGLMYALGGTADWADSQANEVYNPANNSWTARVPHPHSGSGVAAVINGKIYIPGHDSSEVYDPLTDIWASLPPLPNPVIQATGGAINGRLYVSGGRFYSAGSWTGVRNTLQVFTLNVPPVADPGANQTVHLNSVVTLDGGGSSDPDGDYPLTYSWRLASVPAGSSATLTDATIVSPTFTVDKLGDYVAELTVTDSTGLPSAPAAVTISTYNTAPVAAAGDDQAVIVIGSTVNLDGSASYDEDGDPISYSWTLESIPPDSTATLSNAGTVSPSFIADIHGTYVVGLIVTDSLGAVSQMDTVTISFDNVTPVADAGGNQSLVQGEVAFLSGMASTDANMDSLTYRWGFVSKPDGSLADISDTSSATPYVATDLHGTYVLSLVVNDGFADSDPANISIVAISIGDAIRDEIANMVKEINLLPPAAFTNKNMRNALTNKINAVLLMLDQGNYSEALDKFQNDILQKTNGCAYQGGPDSNDWIKDCGAQEQVYPYVMDVIGYLEAIIE